MEKYKISNLSIHQDKTPQTIALIERCFQYKKPNHFEIDFAPLMNRQNLNNCHILFSEATGKVLSHIGVNVRSLIFQDKKVPIAQLGGICVAPEYQGKGYLKTLMNHVLKSYTKNVGMFFLWGDLVELYRKFEFYLAIGLAESRGNTKALKAALEEYEFEKTLYKNLSVEDQKQIHNIYKNILSKKYALLHRNPGHWETIARMTSTDLYLLRDQNGIIVCYFFTNKGQDLTNVIHEVGYFPSYEDVIIQCLSKGTLWLPEKEKHLLPDHSLKYMAMVRLGDHKIFSHFIQEWSHGELSIRGIDGKNISFRHKGESYTDTIETFFLLLFGPSPLPEFREYGRPLFISGLDSI